MESPLKVQKTFEFGIGKVNQECSAGTYEYRQTTPDSLKRKRVLVEKVVEKKKWKDDTDVLNLILMMAVWDINDVSEADRMEVD